LSFNRFHIIWNTLPAMVLRADLFNEAHKVRILQTPTASALGLMYRGV